MIDASKTPTPTWQRYAVAALLTILLVVIGYTVYSKDFRHSSSPGPAASAPAHVAPSAPASRTITSAPTPSTVPGGIPVSTRNPFGN